MLYLSISDNFAIDTSNEYVRVEPAVISMSEFSFLFIDISVVEQKLFLLPLIIPDIFPIALKKCGLLTVCFILSSYY